MQICAQTCQSCVSAAHCPQCKQTSELGFCTGLLNLPHAEVIYVFIVGVMGGVRIHHLQVYAMKTHQ